MKLKANTETREVSGFTGWYGDAKLHHVEGKFAVLKVPGMSYWVEGWHGYQDYQHARMIVCRVTSRKGDTVWLEKLITFTIRY